MFRSRFKGKSYPKITIGLNLFVDNSLKDFETFWRQEEWKLVSLVLERFFTYFFLFSVLISFFVFAVTVRWRDCKQLFENLLNHHLQTHIRYIEHKSFMINRDNSESLASDSADINNAWNCFNSIDAAVRATCHTMVILHSCHLLEFCEQEENWCWMPFEYLASIEWATT